jgi:hypothetical protein
MITTYSESTQEFLDLLRLEPDHSTEALHLLEAGNSRYTTDLKVNFKNSFSTELLSQKETTLLGVALAVNDKNSVLLSFFVQEAREQAASEEEIADTYQRFFYVILVTFVQHFIQISWWYISLYRLYTYETSSLLFTHRASFICIKRVSTGPGPT